MKKTTKQTKVKLTPKNVGNTQAGKISPTWPPTASDVAMVHATRSMKVITKATAGRYGK